MNTIYKTLATLLTISAWLNAQDAQLEQKFKDELENKVFLLRDFASDKEIAVSGDGKLMHQVHPGIWPLAYMEVAHVRTKRKQLLLEGPRVGLRYDDAKKKLVSIRTPVQVLVSVAGPFNSSPDEIVQRVKDAVFMPEGSQLSLLPEYWREYYQGNPKLAKLGLPSDSETLPDANPIPRNIDGEDFYRCLGGSFKIPKPVNTADPEYSEAARALKYQGKNVFSLIVGKSGHVAHIFVGRPLGLGLDEQSIAAFTRWTFTPGTKDGEPANCIVNVETNFNLY